MSKTKAVAITEEQMQELNAAYPVIENTSRPSYPRLAVLADDITEESGTGKNKKIKVIQSAGTFFTSKDQGETDENGKKVWTKEFIDGDTVELVVAFHRYQLKIYDKSLKKYISSSVFDKPEQVLPLYLDKQVIKRGTEKELQSLYPALTMKGKPTSGLKKEMILYVLYNGEIYQFDINQTSQWAFKDYNKSVQVTNIVTVVGSTPETAGGTKYRKLNFKAGRLINSEEFELVKGSQVTLTEQVASDAQYFLKESTKQLESGKQDEELDALASAAEAMD